MKNSNIIKAAAYCALCIMNYALISCSSDDAVNTEAEGPVAAQISAGIGESMTRAVGTEWNKDAIGVRVTSATNNSQMTTLYKNVKYVTTANGEATANFEAADQTKSTTVIFFQDKNETATFAAYAPYQESEPNALPGTDGVVDVETSKNNGSTTAQETIDFIYAEGATASFTSPKAEFTKVSDSEDYSFHHVMTRLVLTIKSGAGFNAADILSTDESLKFTLNLGGLIHSGTFNATTGKAVATTAAEALSTWDITELAHVDDATENTRTYTFVLLPQTLGDEGLSFSATSGGQTYINTTKLNPELASGTSYAYTITVNKTGLTISGCTISDWTPIKGSDVEAM